MRIISVRQPWAWLIIYGGKTHENRSWTTPYRGPLAIQASAGMTQVEYQTCAAWYRQQFRRKLPPADELVRGAIIGLTEVTDCVSVSDSRWFIGPNALVLANQRPLARPLPFPGALSIRALPAETAAQVYLLAA